MSNDPQLYFHSYCFILIFISSDLCVDIVYDLKDYLKTHMKTHMIGGTNFKPKNNEEMILHAAEREKRIKRVFMRMQRAKIRKMFGYKF